MGADAGDGVSADFDSNLEVVHSPFQLFSLRNLINFLLGFSWTGISLYQVISSKPLLVLVSSGVGVLFVVAFFFFLTQIQKLAEDNTFKIKEILNQTAQVYLTVPANKSGKGKIQVSVRGSVKEVDAITDGEKVESGTLVKITGLQNDQIAIVEKI
jgi:hypothetical protein